MSVIFDHVHIVGGGLIGSSLVRGLKAYGLASKVTVTDASGKACKTITGLGFSDGCSQELGDFAPSADLIILATPPGTMGRIAEDLIPVMKAGSLLSDVASIKQDIVAQIAPHLKDGVTFIPGHPIAGTENSGPESGFASLFKHRWCILTPEKPKSAAAKRLKAMWEGLGSDVALMTPERHDLVMATTSHLPHLIAFTLVGTAIDMETVTRNEVVKFSAGGFRDFTRIAASDPVMWRDVFLQNRESVLEVVDRFIEDLSALKRAIRWQEGDQLLDHFAKTRDIRRRIIDAGQDDDRPDFGRDHED